MKRLILPALLFFLVSCSRAVELQDASARDWKYADLRLLDPPDLSNPDQDIIAAYLREQRDSIQIRVDFLNQETEAPPYLIILFDNDTGDSHHLPFGLEIEAQWDILLLLKPDGKAVLFNRELDAIRSARISIFRDPLLDSITVSLQKGAIPGFSIKTKVKLLSFRRLSSTAEFDETEQFLVGSPPPHPGKVMIALWNTFSGKTPAQALRSWDGAHTGPFSSRHGLRWLVEAVEATGVPVSLIDLDRPENWSVLDYLGVAKRIRKLVDQGKIILLHQDYWRTAEITEMDSMTLEGILSVDFRRHMAENALKAENFLILGGDFSKTAWGNYETAFLVLDYIDNHPWVRPVSDTEIHKTLQSSTSRSSLPLESIVRAELLSIPNNEIKDVSEQMLSALTAPGSPIEEELRRQYIGHVGHLIAISTWSRDRQPVLDCSKDLDWDDEPECFLSTHTMAAVIETRGGYISFAFIYQGGRFHQIIGPSYQLATGLSDPVSWNFDEGIAADPSVIPGAFAGKNWHQQSFTPLLIEPASIILQDLLGISQKTFTLTHAGIQFSYIGSEGETFYIPLLIDPWTMTSPNWGDHYQGNFLSGSWAWGIPSELIVCIQSSDSLEFFTFKDSYHEIRLPENPNYAYPPGHYLPFPLALGQITPSGEGVINLEIQP